MGAKRLLMRKGKAKSEVPPVNLGPRTEGPRRRLQGRQAVVAKFLEKICRLNQLS